MEASMIKWFGVLSIFSFICFSTISFAQQPEEKTKSLEEEFQKALEQTSPAPGSIPQQPGPVSPPSGVQTGPPTLGTSGSTATGLSRAFNPAISINGLFLGSYTSREPGEEIKPGEGITTGIHIQEVEAQFSAFVDPYLRADVILALPEGKGIEVEEGYISTLNIPSVIFRIGKFHDPFGKHNLLHTHQFPFIDPPLINERIFGEEGLTEVGVDASYLLKLPWFSEVRLDLLNGDNEVLFHSPKGGDLAYLAHFKNLWDLSDATTLELGESYVIGKNEFEDISQAAGVDLTIKWRPPQRALYRAFIWQTEYLFAKKDPAGQTFDKVGGLYSLVQYQFARRWWIQGRYDFLGIPEAVGEGKTYRVSSLLAFVPTEFSAFRIQYNYLKPEDEEGIHQVLAQVNFTIGSHPAHQY
jgi:hypothetical protein